MAIDIRALRYFEAVATHRSFSSAAEQLHIAQPALSLQIRKLEEELGRQLMVRTSRGVTLTPAGEKFLGHAQDIVRRPNAARDDVRGDVQVPEGPVAVGMPQSLSKFLTVPLISLALQRWPKVRLQIIELNTGYVPEFLLSGRIDLGLTFFPQSTFPFTYTHLLDEELVLVGRPGAYPPIDERRWSEASAVSLAAIAEMPLVLPIMMHSLRELIEGFARQRRLRLNVVAEVNAIAQLLDLAAAGVGSTVLSYASVRESLTRGEISAARISAPPITRPVYLCRMKNPLTTGPIGAVEGLMLEIVRTLVGAGSWPAQLAQ